MLNWVDDAREGGSAIGTNADSLKEAIATLWIAYAHFLMGAKFADLASAPKQKDFGLEKAWFHIQRVLDEFWRRACKEAHAHMHTLNKWVRPRGDLQVGDVVLVLDSEDRARWPLGRIIDTRKSADGLVRTVKVRVGKERKEIVRAAQNVLLLVAATT